VLAARNGVTQGRTFVASVRGVLRGFLVLVESRLASLVVIFGRKREGRIARAHRPRANAFCLGRVTSQELTPGGVHSPLLVTGFPCKLRIGHAGMMFMGISSESDNHAAAALWILRARDRPVRTTSGAASAFPTDSLSCSFTSLGTRNPPKGRVPLFSASEMRAKLTV
jgi:hypothetical protein